MKLTERDLKHIVSECVNAFINEQYYMTESVDETVGSWIKGKFQNAGNAIKNGANVAGSALKNVGSTLANGAKNSADILVQTGIAAIGAKFIAGVYGAMKLDPQNQQLQQAGKQLVNSYKQFVSAATKGNVNQQRQKTQQNVNNVKQAAQNAKQNYKQSKVNTGSFSDNMWQSIGKGLNYANQRAAQANQNLG